MQLISSSSTASSGGEVRSSASPPSTYSGDDSGSHPHSGHHSGHHPGGDELSGGSNHELHTTGSGYACVEGAMAIEEMDDGEDDGHEDDPNAPRNDLERASLWLGVVI